MDYIKFGRKRISIELAERLTLAGNVELSRDIGKYYSRKAVTNPKYYEKSISFFLIGANAGCVDCMINVSKNALKYGKYLAVNEQEGDCKMYFGFAFDYAYKAFSKNRFKAQKHLIRSMIAINKHNVKIGIIY